MKLFACLVMLAILIMPVAVVHCDNRILGTNIEMDIAALFKRNEITNTYHTFGDTATMKVAYARLGLNACIAEYKPRIFRERLYLLDKEWHEGENKYLMLFHLKRFESIKRCILFIGNQSETVIFVSEMRTALDPSIQEKIIDAYLTCKMTNGEFEFTEAFFYKPKIPDSFVLLRSEGGFFEVRRSGDQETEETLIRFYGSFYGRDPPLEEYLIALLHENETILESSEYKMPESSIRAWRALSQETGENNYRCQYLMLLADRRMLYIDAAIVSQEPQIALEELRRIVDSISFD